MAERRSGGPRAIWKGALTFGLVSVPVSMHSATRREAALPFRLLHAKDAAPIDYRRFCSSEGVEVPWRDVVKGYEYAKNRFVVLTREELARAQVEASQTIEIREFVPAQAIDLAYIEAPYWLAPTGPGRKAYTLLRAALAKAGRVGIGTFVLRQRERLIAVRPSGSALMLTTMRFADELKGAEGLGTPQDGKVSRREIDLALQLVATLAADWKPERYRDTYRETLRALIERKRKGEAIVAPEGPAPRKVIDLVDALRRSLETRRREPAVAGRRRRRGPAMRRRAAA